MLGKGSPESQALGQLGSIYITDTNAHAGDFGCVQALEDAVIATLVSGKLHDGTTSVMTGTLTAIPLPAGVVLFGRFTSITLTSGKVIAYNL